MKQFKISDHFIGDGNPTFVIAEIAQSHEGSLGIARSYIDAVAETGADAIKFQTHLAKFESTLDEPFRISFSRQDKSRFDYWKRMEFTEEEWEELAKHANKKGLIFLSSPFSIEAVNLLDKINVPAWKIGSGEFASDFILEYIAKTKKPVLLSTGMSTYDDIRNMVKKIEGYNLDYAILQCTSSYPTKLEDVGLNVIEDLRRVYDCPVGLSDHSGTLFPALTALARRINIIEVHVTFDKRLFGPDVSSSITLDDLSFLVEVKNAIYTMDQNPVNKDEMAIKLSELRKIFSKSIATSRFLSKGTVLEENMIAPKKPGTGIPFSEKSKIIGKSLKHDIYPDRLLKWEDLND